MVCLYRLGASSAALSRQPFCTRRRSASCAAVPLKLVGGHTMDDHAALFRPLLTGLHDVDQAEILEVLERARGEQLHRKRYPPRRRRRDANGVLVPPPEELS
jgi:hypothetical protein